MPSQHLWDLFDWFVSVVACVVVVFICPLAGWMEPPAPTIFPLTHPRRFCFRHSALSFIPGRLVGWLVRFDSFQFSRARSSRDVWRTDGSRVGRFISVSLRSGVRACGARGGIFRRRTATTTCRYAPLRCPRARLPPARHCTATTHTCARTTARCSFTLRAPLPPAFCLRATTFAHRIPRHHRVPRAARRAFTGYLRLRTRFSCRLPATHRALLPPAPLTALFHAAHTYRAFHATTAAACHLLRHVVRGDICRRSYLTRACLHTPLPATHTTRHFTPAFYTACLPPHTACMWRGWDVWFLLLPHWRCCFAAIYLLGRSFGSVGTDGSFHYDDCACWLYRFVRFISATTYHLLLLNVTVQVPRCCGLHYPHLDAFTTVYRTLQFALPL